MFAGKASHVAIGDVNTTKTNRFDVGVRFDDYHVDADKSFGVVAQERNTFNITSDGFIVIADPKMKPVSIAAPLNEFVVRNQPTGQDWSLFDVEYGASLTVGQAGGINRIDAEKNSRLNIFFGAAYTTTASHGTYGKLKFIGDLNDIRAYSLYNSNDHGNTAEVMELSLLGKNNFLDLQYAPNFVSMNANQTNGLRLFYGNEETLSNVVLSHASELTQHKKPAAIAGGWNTTINAVAKNDNVFLAKNIAIRDTQVKNPNGGISLRADRNTIASEGSAISVFNSDKAKSSQNNVTIVGGISLKGGINAAEVLGQSRVTIAYSTPTHEFNVDKEHPEIKEFLGNWIPDKDQSTVTGNLIGVSSTLKIIPISSVPAKISINSPVIAHIGGGGIVLSLSEDSALSGSVSRLNVFNNRPTLGTTVIGLAKGSQWRLFGQDNDPYYLNSVSQLINAGSIYFSSLQDQKSRLMWVESYQGLDNSLITMKLSKRPEKSDFMLVHEVTAESKPSDLSVINGKEVLEDLSDGGSIMFASVLSEPDADNSLFKVGQVAYVAKPAMGALTTETLLIEKHSVSEDKEKSNNDSKLKNPVKIPLIGFDKNQLIQVQPKELAQSLEELRQQVLANPTEHSFNYYLVKGTKKVDILPVVSDWLATDYVLSIGRVDTLAKRRGEIIKSKVSPLWLRGAFYQVKKSGKFKMSNEMVEVGHDFPSMKTGHLNHKLSSSLSILEAGSEFDIASGKNRSRNLSAHLYDTITWNTNTYVDVSAQVGYARIHFDLSARDGSGLYGKSSHWVTGVGAELGHAFDWGRHHLTPQLQVQYTYIGSSAWDEGVSHHKVNSLNSVIGRVGMDYTYTHEFKSGNSMTALFGVNAYHEFCGTSFANAESASARIDSQNTMKGE